MKKLFGGKKKEEPKNQEPKQKSLNEMNNDELKQTRKDFQKKINKEEREINREIMKMEMLQKQAKANLERECKKKNGGDKFIKQTFAKQVIQTQKMRERYMQNQAQVKNLGYGIDQFIASIKLGQVMVQTGGLMKQINQMVNIKELNVAMTDMQKEMMKFGMVQEMVQGAMEDMDQEADIDNEQDVDALIMNVEQQIMQKEQPQNVMPAMEEQKNNNMSDIDKQMQQLLG